MSPLRRRLAGNGDAGGFVNMEKDNQFQKNYWAGIDGAIEERDLLALLKLDAPPQLTQEEKTGLIGEIISQDESGVPEGMDEPARQLMAASHIGLAVREAQAMRKRSRSNIPLPDFLGAGLEGLTIAMIRYNPKKCTKFNPDEPIQFSTYATFWIRRQVKRAAADTLMGEINYYTVANIGRLQEAERGLRNDGLEVTTQWLAERMGKSEPWVKELEKINQRRAHLPLDSIATEIILTKHSRPVLRPVEEEALVGLEMKELRRAIKELPDELRQVVELRFGLNGRGEPMTYKEVSRELGISKKKVWEREKLAEGEIRRCLGE